MRVIATAGHVDHGKSSLVLALTGTDPDRFPEEKARGLTIDIGFAFATIGDHQVGFVDVPGHVRFVKNMLAGVGAVDIAMVIVAATEGWMPQTEEHVRILELLDIRHGMIVITKADLVDDETLELAQLELADHLEDTNLADWTVVVADSLSGRGLDEVREKLDGVLRSAPGAKDLGRARLWVDRVFAAKGAGTVVTGTLTLGSLSIDDEVLIEPGGRTARVRAIESHHQRLDRVDPGSRVALNLAGIDHTDVHRGDALVLPGLWATPAAVDVEILEAAGQRLPARGFLTAHIGSGEYRVRWRVLDEARRIGRVRLPEGLPLAPGDRLVLRSSGRRATVGGAVVVDVEPPRRTVAAIERCRLQPDDLLFAQREVLTVDDVVRLRGLNRVDANELISRLVDAGVAVRASDAVMSAQRVGVIREAVLVKVLAFHAAQPDIPGMELTALSAAMSVDPTQLKIVLKDQPSLVTDRELIRSVDHVGLASQTADGKRFVEALRARPFNPPTADELRIEKRIERALVREGVVVYLDGVVFSAVALDDARKMISRAVIERGTLAVADIRDLLGTTRKYAMPIVNQLDREGVTRRRGDDRIAGPRAIATTDSL